MDFVLVTDNKLKRQIKLEKTCFAQVSNIDPERYSDAKPCDEQGKEIVKEEVKQTEITEKTSYTKKTKKNE